MISEHPSITVVALARNGIEALNMTEKHKPDVLILDLLMPEMDGLTALKRIMRRCPTPTIIFSVLDPHSLDKSVQALLIGAFDYIVKPGGVWKEEFPKFREKLISKVILASKSQIKRVYKNLESSKSKTAVRKKPVPVQKTTYKPIKKNDIAFSSVTPIQDVKLESNVIVMGASVGGPKTIKSILNRIPKSFPAPILIVQHISREFCDVFARSLNDVCNLKVKIAENGEPIKPGVVYIAPGGEHLEVSVNGEKNPCISVYSGDPVNFCIPSISVLFNSAAKVYKKKAMGILLTGMGEDGVSGLKAIQKLGGITIAESEETCVLYGMPKMAIKSHAADLILPNYEIQAHLIKFAKNMN